MNKTFIILLSLTILYSCKGKRNNAQLAERDSSVFINNSIDSLNIKRDAHYFWEVVPDDKSNKLIIKKTQPVPGDSLTADNVIQWINSRYDHITLQFVKIAHDTLFVKIRNSNFLTQQMGSTGADIFITEATYNLSELNNIVYVYFDFKEGDHASPGTYSRGDFTNIKFSSY